MAGLHCCISKQNLQSSIVVNVKFSGGPEPLLLSAVTEHA